MATKLKREDPQWFDNIVQIGADAAVRAVPARKRYAFALGISPSRASRHRAGDPHSPSTQFLVALSKAGSAWPLINEGIAVVVQHSIRFIPIEKLHARLNELNEAEHVAECDENRQTLHVATNMTPGQLEEAARANVKEAEISLERAAILRELARRARRNG
jgi:hypothetical protein